MQLASRANRVTEWSWCCPSDSDWPAPAGVRVATGGATRSASVRAGLACVPARSRRGRRARRGASARDARAVRAGRRRGARRRAMPRCPALPVTDTVKRVRDQHVRRDGAARRPRHRADAAGIPAGRAGSRARRRRAIGTDDAALVEAAGGTVVVVEGEARNLKITVFGDLELAQALIEGAHVVREPSRARLRRASRSASEPPLVLGGVTIADAPRLAGHSDGDAVAHAVADALLGPAGLPDLGTSVSRRRRAVAGRRLDGPARRRREPGRPHGWWLENVDVTIAAETPRLASYIGGDGRESRRRARAAARARCGRTGHRASSVRPKRGEGLGAIGRAEGIAVWAVALLAHLARRG